MEDQRRRDVALFRYSLVRAPADPALSQAERGAMVRGLSEMEHVTPDGRRVRVARSTLDEWIRAYRRGGFDALVPKPRVVPPRTDVEVLGLAEKLKREQPGRTAAQVRRVMAEAGVASPSVRSLQRHFVRVGLDRLGPDGQAPQASEPNELWTGDALHGPLVGGRKAYLLAFIDDFSRLLPGYRWTGAEDSVRLESALRSGLASRGVPRAILVDRGSAFVAAPLARACAVMGIRLIHASPRAAATKGKDRKIFQDGEGPVRRGTGRPGRGGRSGRAEPAVQRLGGGGLSPSGAYRDRGHPTGALRFGRPASASFTAAFARGVFVVGGEDGV